MFQTDDIRRKTLDFFLSMSLSHVVVKSFLVSRLKSYVSSLTIIKRCRRFPFVQRDVPAGLDADESAELVRHVGGGALEEDVVAVWLGPHFL